MKGLTQCQPSQDPVIPRMTASKVKRGAGEQTFGVQCCGAYTATDGDPVAGDLAASEADDAGGADPE
jgi:hypothetical protein